MAWKAALVVGILTGVVAIYPGPAEDTHHPLAWQLLSVVLGGVVMAGSWARLRRWL